MALADAVRQFNQGAINAKLPTRIAVHAGEFFLGNIGAGDHYEYGVTGDTVNTVSRLDGLNKYLETKILVSREAVGESEGFLTREAGSFLLKGKAQPVVVYELLGRAAEADDQRKKACAIFSEALGAFKVHTWTERQWKLIKVSVFSKKMASRASIKLCAEYWAHPPEEPVKL